MPAFEPKQPIRIALVLGGGGSKGLAILGAMQELEAAGIRPDLIVGCSAGAIAGAMYADEHQLDKAEKVFLPLKRADLLDFSFLKPLMGLADGKRLQNFVQKTLHSKTFEELKTPLILVATDLMTGDTIELSHGDIAPAVRASCAFPGVFKPVPLYGRYLVDGGVSCPIPVSIAKKYGAEIVIAIDVSGKLTQNSPTNLVGISRRSLEIAYRQFIQQSLTQADIVIQMEFEDSGTFSDHLNERLYQAGREMARKQLPEVQQKLVSKSSL